MKQPAAFFVAVLLGNAACASHHVQPAAATIDCSGTIEIQGASYLGVIFPPECASGAASAVGERAVEYWLPTAEIVAKAEQGLRAALDEARKSPSSIDAQALTSPARAAYVAADIGAIVDRLGRYRRQYLGLRLADGRQRLLINFFPSAEAGASDSFGYWKQRWVVVDDGGNSYWRIQYDVPSGAFMSFDCNGNA